MYHKLPRVVEIYGDGSARNSCFCSIPSGIILGYVEKCFRDRGLPSSSSSLPPPPPLSLSRFLFLFSLDNREREICRVSCRLAELTGGLMRESPLFNGTTVRYRMVPVRSRSFGTRLGKVVLVRESTCIWRRKLFFLVRPFSQISAVRYVFFSAHARVSLR